MNKILALVLVLVAPFARAAVVSGDLFAPGDGLLTVDTIAGLEWTNRSVGSEFTLGDFLDGNTPLDELGFRLASVDLTTSEPTEMVDLLMHAGADCLGSYEAACFSPANRTAFDLLSGTGWLGVLPPFSSSKVSSPFNVIVQYQTMPLFIFEEDASGDVSIRRNAALAIHPEYRLSEIALVRAVPAPAVGWLLAPAFGVLGWARRRLLRPIL